MGSEIENKNRQKEGSQVAGIEMIQLADVDFSDTTYRITTSDDVDQLVSSIDRLGVLVPPLVKPVKQHLMIISGFQRLEACRFLGRQSVAARVAPADATPLDCAHWAIAENGLQRSLNPLEKARAVALLVETVPQKDRIAIEAAATGLPSNADMIAKLLDALKLPAVVQTRLADGTVGLAMALALGKFKTDFAERCVEIFSILGVGFNRQREILTLISEIAARDDIPPLSVLKHKALQEIWDDADIKRPQKLGRIRDWLYYRRYPNLAQAEETFKVQRRQLKLGQYIQLTAPRFFESDIYTFSIRFNSLERFRTELQRLERIGEDENLKNILSRSDSIGKQCP